MVGFPPSPVARSFPRLPLLLLLFLLATKTRPNLANGVVSAAVRSAATDARGLLAVRRQHKYLRTDNDSAAKEPGHEEEDRTQAEFHGEIGVVGGEGQSSDYGASEWRPRNATNYGSQQDNVSAAVAVNRGDTLESLLKFLKESGSPVSGVMELRSLLLAQKEEKIVLRSLVDQMSVDLQGIKYVRPAVRSICLCEDADQALKIHDINGKSFFKPGTSCRYQMKLHSDEIQVHAEVMTRLRDELDAERAARRRLEETMSGAGAKKAVEHGEKKSIPKPAEEPMGQVMGALSRVRDLSARQDRELLQLKGLQRELAQHATVQAEIKADVRQVNEEVSAYPGPRNGKEMGSFTSSRLSRSFCFLPVCLPPAVAPSTRSGGQERGTPTGGLWDLVEQ